MTQTDSPEAASEPLASDSSPRQTPPEAGSDETVLLRLKGITKRFGNVVANDDVSFDVNRGQVRGLLGENGAGKTTLMSIVAGLVKPDAGVIEIHGEEVAFRSPLDAKRHGIGMVYQHFMLVPTMTVAENVALGKRDGWIPGAGLSAVSRRIVELSDLYGLAVDPRAQIEDLPLGARQRVEIVRLLVRGAELFIFDEPTAVLAPHEVEGLIRVLRALAADGKGVIFITHKLDELFAVCDRSTVLRDGHVVATVKTAEADKAALARMMVGRDIAFSVDRQRAETGPSILSVRGLRLGKGAKRNGVTFEVRAGEVFGIAGVDGNGQEALVAALTGLTEPAGGEIRLEGCSVPCLEPRDFIGFGGAAIHADRHRDGMALELSLSDNVMMTEFGERRFSRYGLLRRERLAARCRELLAGYGVHAAGLHVQMRQLSGGNQQKVVVARELGREPSLLVAAQPTRGLDVAAVEFVYQRLAQHKRAGGATLLISSELEEILSLSDRIGVMVGGGLSESIDAEEANPERLGLLMAGQTRTQA